jgi:hypothetical protein
MKMSTKKQPRVAKIVNDATKVRVPATSNNEIEELAVLLGFETFYFRATKPIFIYNGIEAKMPSKLTELIYEISAGRRRLSTYNAYTHIARKDVRSRSKRYREALSEVSVVSEYKVGGVKIETLLDYIIQESVSGSKELHIPISNAVYNINLDQLLMMQVDAYDSNGKLRLNGNGLYECPVCGCEYETGNKDSEEKHKKVHSLIVRHRYFEPKLIVSRKARESARLKAMDNRYEIEELLECLMAEYSSFVILLGEKANKCLGLSYDSYSRLRLGQLLKDDELGIRQMSKLEPKKFLDGWPKGKKHVTYQEWNKLIENNVSQGHTVKDYDKRWAHMNPESYGGRVWVEFAKTGKM